MGILSPDPAPRARRIRRPRARAPGAGVARVCATVLGIVCVCIGYVEAASHCFGCQSTILDCDYDRNVCRSRCEKKVPCDSEDSYCMMATYGDPDASNGSDVRLFADLLCYPATRLSAGDVTTHYCGQVAADSTASSSDYDSPFPTCMCTHDYCNDAIYLLGSEVPKLPDVQEPNGTTEPDLPNTAGKTPKNSISNTPPGDLGDPVDEGQQTLAIVLSVVLAIILMGAVVFAIIGFLKYRQMQKLKQDRKSSTESTSLDLTTEDSEVKVIGQDTPPESPVHMRGNYLPITLSTVIGRGRFGAVWRADLKYGDDRAEMTVAVKVFHEIDSGSWSVEKEMFTDEKVMLKHENVVEFMAAEVRRQGSYDVQRQFWLVTRYYAKGSLYMYLKHHTVSWQELCRLAGTTARGVAHLHADVYGPLGLHKIPLAHRDLKTSNVLVKDDGTCAIADFGLAIQLDPSLSIDQLANSGQAGTPRYMAPEALESKVNLHDIESFKQMDVYSLSLIVWEIAKRCTVSDVVLAESEHVLPFYDTVPGRASIDDMKSVVAVNNQRPAIPTSWLDNPGMRVVAATLDDTWDTDPEARLTAHGVEARFTELITWSEGVQNPGRNSLHTVTAV